MREEIGRLLGWLVEEDGDHVFCFVESLYDYGYTGVNGYRLAGAALFEIRGVEPEHHAWLLTDDGLVYRFEDYEEMHGKSREEIIAWGKQEIADAIAADGHPYHRLYDTPDPEWEAQLRAAGFPESANPCVDQFPVYVCFDTPGSWFGSLDLDHVCDEALLVRVREMEALRGTVEVAT